MEEKTEVTKKRIKRSMILLPMIVLVIIAIGFLFWQVYTDKNYEIETITEFSYFKVYENEKYGVMDAVGNVLVEPKYDMIVIPNPTKPVFIGYFNYDSQKGEYQTEVVNEKNEKILTKYRRSISTYV